MGYPRRTMKTLLEATQHAADTRWRYKDKCETYKGHITGVLGLMGVLDIPLSKVDQGWIDLARQRIRLGEKRAASANRKLSTLRSVLSLAGGKQLSIPGFPVEVNAGARPFTDVELKLVDNWFREQCGSNVTKAYYAVLRDTGSRGLEELSKVTVEDINWDTREITLRSKKGRNGDLVERTVWLTDVSERALSWLVNQEQDPLFTYSQFNSFRARFTDMKEQLFHGDSRVKPYSLRHTFAMRLHAKGVSIHAIARVMGHASIQTTLSYLHTTAEDKADILSALTD
jgi:integrase